MVPADFLQRFGFLVVREFLEEGTCRALLTHAAMADREAAGVSRSGTTYHDERTRAAQVLAMPGDLEADIHARLAALTPRLGAHFGASLSGCGRPSFLQYCEGDFFAAHRDSSNRDDAAATVKSRQVSTIIFLNDDRRGHPGSYEGGALAFYGLFDDPALADRGFAVQPEAGMLLAFPSEVRHEVQRVVRGTRYSIVAWFAGSPGS